MPLWVVQVAPVDMRAKLSIRGIIRITLSAFSITEKVGTEGEQGLGARPLDLGARPLSGPLWAHFSERVSRCGII